MFGTCPATGAVRRAPPNVAQANGSAERSVPDDEWCHNQGIQCCTRCLGIAHVSCNGAPSTFPTALTA
eukprot:7486449-Pyramimonas_sp.AAC.1